MKTINLNEPMVILIDYYGNHRVDKGWYIADETRLVQTEEFHGTPIEAFRKVEKANERLRYCNGCYYKFRDSEIEMAYHDWSRNLTQSQWYDVVGMTYANTD